MTKRVEGFPDWARDERYDVDVRFPPDTPPASVNLMLQELLVDRFKMAARLETRQVPIYALVMARTDRALGPQLRPADVECAPVRDRQTLPMCQARVNVSGGTLLFPYHDMQGLARTLTAMQGFLGRPVVNNTGLSGFHRIELQFAPPPDATGAAARPAASEAPSIFTALQEQLGLKLESATGPVQFLVVDHLERPTPD